MKKNKIKDNSIRFCFNLTEYPLEVVYGTAYVFIDRAYLFLESKSKNKIEVSLKGKKRLSPKKLGELKGEFLNELLNYSFRVKLAKGNKEIRGYVISQALLSAVGGGDANEENFEEEIGHKNDPLGIAIPWEEKYGKDNKKKTKNDN